MHSFQSPWTFHWLHFQVAVSWSFLYALFLPTILTKHQALAPSGPILFCSKYRFFRVEFSLRCSAKAWQEKSGPWVQLLNWSNSESSQSSLPWKSLQPRDEGWSIRSIEHQTLLNTSWCFGHVNSHLFVIASHEPTSLPWQWDPNSGPLGFSQSSGSSSQQGALPGPCKATQILFEKAVQDQNSEGMEICPKNTGRPRSTCWRSLARTTRFLSCWAFPNKAASSSLHSNRRTSRVLNVL